MLKDSVTTATLHDGGFAGAQPTRRARQTVDADLDAIGVALDDLPEG